MQDDRGASRESERTYVLKRRAETQAETRRRIAEAAVGLHTTVGPARTTVAAVCRAAGVRRATFYRHFPDERSLFAACGTLHLDRSPAPDPAACASVPERVARLRAGLASAYYRANAAAMAPIIRDAEVLPIGGAFAAYRDGLADVLAAAWLATGSRRSRIRATCGFAADFRVWQALAIAQGMSDNDAIDVMVGAVSAAVG